MTEKEIDDLVKEIMNFPKVESNNPVSTMYGFDVDTLINTLRDFKRLPAYDEVLKQNQKYKEVFENVCSLLNDYEMQNDEIISSYCKEIRNAMKEVE